MNRSVLAVILYADGQTPGQIAWQLACPTESVRTCLRRARREYVAQGRVGSRGLHRIALRALLVEDGLLAPEVSSHATTMVDVGTSEGGSDAVPRIHRSRGDVRMTGRERIPATPSTLTQQTNFDLRDKQLAMLDDNARFIVRRMVARAYAQGYDDGWCSGQDDARCDAAIQRDQEPGRAA